MIWLLLLLWMPRPTELHAVPEIAAAKGNSLVADACARLKTAGGWIEDEGELHYYCALPEPVRNRIPAPYWLTPEAYQRWLQRLPTRPQTTLNFGHGFKDGHQKVNGLVLHPNVCRFYSIISPSFQQGSLDPSHERTYVVSDSDELLAGCREIQRKQTEGGHLCSAIELAGHSIQSVGLDLVMGIDRVGGRTTYLPSKERLIEIGECLRGISTTDAPVVFSTCGGDRALDAEGRPTDRTHFWPGKAKAQQELSQLLQMTVLSGIGYVSGTEEGGVRSDWGWHVTRPPGRKYWPFALFSNL